MVRRLGEVNVNTVDSVAHFLQIRRGHKHDTFVLRCFVGPEQLENATQSEASKESFRNIGYRMDKVRQLLRYLFVRIARVGICIYIFSLCRTWYRHLKASASGGLPFRYPTNFVATSLSLSLARRVLLVYRIRYDLLVYR
jgi:hypothetical protein